MSSDPTSPPLKCLETRLLLGLADTPPPGVGWVDQRLKKICVPKLGLKFPASLIVFISSLRNIFLVWVDGWVGGWVRRGCQGPQ